MIASELSKRVYRIDLSSVVSKYIGETEKNLKCVFDAAASGDAVLFFDEADALFGTRSESRDAGDRYANTAVNFLMQRIEDFPGIVVVAANLGANIDDAVLRRFHHVIELP